VPTHFMQLGVSDNVQKWIAKCPQASMFVFILKRPDFSREEVNQVQNRFVRNADDMCVQNISNK